MTNWSGCRLEIPSKLTQRRARQGTGMDNRIRDEVGRTWDRVLDHEYAVIEDVYESVGNPCRLVDVGCGSLGLLGRRGGRLLGLHANSLGIDIDRESLSRNRQVMRHVCASCYSLPLK